MVFEDDEERQWLDSRHVDWEELEHKLLKIPEPVHRIGFGKRSGISLRKKRPVTIRAIKETCEYYERKCAGKYASDSLAARYLFDLSREIQEMMDRFKQTVDKKDARNEYLEHCMKDWDETFGPVHSIDPRLTAKADKTVINKVHRNVRAIEIVSPSRLKLLIDEYMERILFLTTKVKQMELRFSEQERRFTLELDEQAKVIRDQYHSQTDFLVQNHENAVRGLQKQHERQVKQLNQEIHNLKKDLKHRKSKEEGLSHHVNSYEDRIGDLKQKVNRLKEKLKVQKEANSKSRDAIIAQAKQEAQAHLERQLDSVRRKSEQVQKETEEKLENYQHLYVDPLKNEIEQYKKYTTDVQTENKYLRQRVLELNKLLSAFQSALSN